MKCSKCGTEFSDNKDICPNCGYSISSKTLNSTKNSLFSSNKLTNKNKFTKIVITLICLIILFTGSFFIYSNYKQKKAIEEHNIILEEYKKDFNDVMGQMLISSNNASDILKLTSSVWSNCIFKKSDINTDIYTKPKGYFESDFNIAICNLYSDSNIIVKITNLNKDKTNINQKIKKLQNPPDEYKDLYTDMIDLYGTYQSILDLAITPKGTLETFNKTTAEKTCLFSESYQKLEVQLSN